MPDNLQQAIIAIKSGDKKTGRELLMEVLKADSRNENAWLWMTQVLDSDDERIKCLETVLKINPNNEKAKHGLTIFQQRQATPKLRRIEKSSQSYPKSSLPKNATTTNRKTPLLIITLVVLILISCGCLFISLLPNLSKPRVIATFPINEGLSKEDTTPALDIGPQVFEIGQVIKIGQISLVVLGWEEVEGTEFEMPEEGNRFIAVEVLFVNPTNKDVTIYSNTMFLKDSDARPYGVDFIATTIVKGGGIGGTLIPGERLRSKLGFQVPTGTQGLQFIFEDPTKGKAIINLGPNPVNVEPPTEFIGK